MNLLEKGVFAELWSKDEDVEIGTLRGECERLSRNSVDINVMKAYDEDKRFATNYLEALTVEAALDYFKMESINSIPSNVPPTTNINHWIEEHIGNIIDEYVFPGWSSEKPERHIVEGSSSARLPALNKTSSLVASPCANPCPKKKNKEKSRKARDKKEMQLKTTPHDTDIDVQVQNESDTLSKSNKPTSKLKLTVYMPDVADDYLEQRKMSEMEAYFRRKRENYMETRPRRESSSTSMQKRRLLSAKSRDHLLSLMPTKEASKNCIDEDLVISAKQGLDMLRRHSSRRVCKTETNEINTLYKQSKKASKLRDIIFGVRDKTNNSVETVNHVSNNRRSHVLAPISVTNNDLNAVQEEMTAYFAEKLRENDRISKDKTCFKHSWGRKISNRQE